MNRLPQALALLALLPLQLNCLRLMLLLELLGLGSAHLLLLEALLLLLLVGLLGFVHLPQRQRLRWLWLLGCVHLRLLVLLGVYLGMLLLRIVVGVGIHPLRQLKPLVWLLLRSVLRLCLLLLLLLCRCLCVCLWCLMLLLLLLQRLLWWHRRLRLQLGLRLLLWHAGIAMMPLRLPLRLLLLVLELRLQLAHEAIQEPRELQILPRLRQRHLAGASNPTLPLPLPLHRSLTLPLPLAQGLPRHRARVLRCATGGSRVGPCEGRLNLLEEGLHVTGQYLDLREACQLDREGCLGG